MELTNIIPLQFKNSYLYNNYLFIISVVKFCWQIKRNDLNYFSVFFFKFHFSTVNTGNMGDKTFSLYLTV